MHGTDRQLNTQPDPQEYDYDKNPMIQSPPTFFNKFFFFNRLVLLYHYLKDIKKETLYRYNDSFKPMLTTNRILEKFFKNKKTQKDFNMAYEIFRMEQRCFILLLIISIIAGLTSLVPIYFQSILVKAVLGNTGNYYSLAVVVTVMFGRFMIQNYMLSLSSNIALNVKLYLHNTFMRVVFYTDPLQTDVKIKKKSKYLDVDLIGEAIYYIPYLIISQIIVIGVIVFVFTYTAVYGCIILSIFIIMYILIGICGKLALQTMRLNSQSRAERENFEHRSLANLMKTALQRAYDYIYRLLIAQRTQQVWQSFKINIFYIIGQTFGEGCIVASNIVLTFLFHNSEIAQSNQYYSVLFIVTCFYPMRYSVYGFFTLIKAYEAYEKLSIQLKTINSRTLEDIQNFPKSDHEKHVFAENIGDCFEYQYNTMDREQEEQLMLTQLALRRRQSSFIYTFDELKDGEVLMVLSRVDSRPSTAELFQHLIASKPLNSSLAMINNSHFMLPESLRENILFYSPYKQEDFDRIVEITQLTALSKQIWSSKGHVNEKYLKYSEWHQTRIEVARALYNNVDILIIDKPNFLEDLTLLNNVLNERKRQKKITIIANNTYKYYFKLADRILVLGRRNQKEVGTFQSLHTHKESLFNYQFLRHHQKIDHSNHIKQVNKDCLEGVLQMPRFVEKPLNIQKGTFFEFFNFIHRKGEFVVIASIITPPCFKYYLQYLLGLSLTTDISTRYLIFGLIYLFFIFLRGFAISYYTNFSSLSLYRKICRKYNRLNAHQILQIYQKPAVDFDYHSRIIDRNLVMDFQYGQSIIIEIVVSFVVYSVGQPLYIAVAIPVIVAIVYVNGKFALNARKIYLLKLQEMTGGCWRHISFAVDRFRSITKYLKINELNDKFHSESKVELIYDCNIEWLETSVRTMAELMVWIIFVIYLVIMIKTVENQNIYTSLVSLGCSMFINLMYLNTFYLKAFRQMEISLVSLTICMDLLKNEPNPTHRQLLRLVEPERIKKIQYIQSILYNGVTLRYFRHVCGKITLSMKEGDRIVMCGNSNSFKELIFYMLENRIFDMDEIKGDIIINGEIHRQYTIDGLHFLHSNPILPFFGTIYQALSLDKPDIKEDQLQKMMIAFFQTMELTQLFTTETEINSLSTDMKELFQVFRIVMIQNCKVLVIISGLDNIDIVSRRKLTKWLLKRQSINILIETTNIREMIELYPKQYLFEDMKVKLLKESKGQERQHVLKRWQSHHSQGSDKRFSSEEKMEEKDFDSVLKLEREKKV